MRNKESWPISVVGESYHLKRYWLNLFELEPQTQSNIKISHTHRDWFTQKYISLKVGREKCSGNRAVYLSDYLFLKTLTMLDLNLDPDSPYEAFGLHFNCRFSSNYPVILIWLTKSRWWPQSPMIFECNFLQSKHPFLIKLGNALMWKYSTSTQLDFYACWIRLRFA